MTDPTPINFEIESRIVDEVAVLDLDRTLLNSSMVTQLVLAGLAAHGVSAGRIDKTIRYVEAQTGNSFYLFDYIENKFSSDMLEAVVADIMQNDVMLEEIKEDLLCPGADKLIYALEEQGTPSMILTYGEENYQGFKAALFRKLIGKTSDDLPVVVTNVANKSEWVENAWFTEGDEFGNIPTDIFDQPIRTRVVAIVDDKKSNLISYDDRVMGILVDNRVNAPTRVTSTAEVASAVASGVHLADIAHLYDDIDKAS